MPESLHRTQYGTATIAYSLCYRPRRTLAIEVYPDGRVSVLAPPGTPLAQVAQKVTKRARWILRQQREFNHYPPPQPPRQYVAGETHRYLGRQYRLRLESALRPSVRLMRGTLEVHTPDPNRAGALLERWLRNRAEIVFAERFQVVLERLRKFGCKHSGAFYLKVMSKRWGSCTADGKIYLNPRLIAAPKECIDYVITHELCHTLIHRHSSEFYVLLTRCLPDWKLVKERLNRIVESGL